MIQALMKINCDGPSADDFDPEEAITKWLTSGLEADILLATKYQFPGFQFLIDLQTELHPPSASLKFKQYLFPFLILSQLMTK